MSNNSDDAQASISLPKGGGAIKGIGETFQPNLFSGTGNFTIPIALSPGRGDFGPKLSLQYSSGNGNGPFGLGWQLSVPRVARKTEKGLPRYDDSDVYVMSGAEDLVPCLTEVTDQSTGAQTWQPVPPVTRAPYLVYRYRPRTEGLFARIERWVHDATGEVHWRTTTKENITSIYGASADARVADPRNSEHVYEWLLQETFDAVGNRIRYEYARDDPGLYSHTDPGLGLPAQFDQNRDATQLYLRRIYYANLADPLLDDQGRALTYPDGTPIGNQRDGHRYALEVFFDYGDYEIPTGAAGPDPEPADTQELFGPDPAFSAQHNPVPIREDRFSDFRAGFEIRTLRRCRRVLMFHHFAELGARTLVRSTDFSYQQNPETGLSLLSAATVTGYRKDTAGRYQSASMPPATFGYSPFEPQAQRYQPIRALGADVPSQPLSDPDYALVDLVGDGLPDVLHSGPTGFRYWTNLGDGVFDRPRTMPQIPAGVALSQPGVGFGDVNGDGRADLLVHTDKLAGFFATTAQGTWRTFTAYPASAAFQPSDRNVRLFDLSGNGLSDALLTLPGHFVFFECLGERGFAAPQYIPRVADPDTFPDVFFDDPAGRVRLADMTGDGLRDIVQVYNGHIEYWPNLGYGRFGKRITMGNAPHLEVDFNPRRLFLADLNGTGCADLVYVDSTKVYCWFNQSGNQWSPGYTIAGTPSISDVDAIEFADVFGTGTATLLWSYPHAAHPEANYKALDLCGGVKPYVLTETSNSLGTTTRVSYSPSTKHYLADRAAGTPWITSLPFPVQVVDTVEVIDHISKTKLVTTYLYHHGYFDGREREFRGFGRVDQFDTETFDEFSAPGLHEDAGLFDNNDRAYHLAPVETRSWFHTGVYADPTSSARSDDAFDYRQLSARFRDEFYCGDPEAVPLDEHRVDTSDCPAEAYRALRGSLLRTEIYAHDATSRAPHPYQVSENRYRVSGFQPQDGNQHGVFFADRLESVSYAYERNPADPRISHALTLAIDAFGNPLQVLTIGYGRRAPDPQLPTATDRDTQLRTLITYTENSYTNGVDDPLADPENYRAPLPSESRSYELTGFTPAANRGQFSTDEWGDNFARITAAAEIPYESSPDPQIEQKRLIGATRTCYRADDLSGLLARGALQSLALPGESYRLALTAGLLTQVYGARVDDTMLTDEGGYVHSEGDTGWWIPSGRIFYSPTATDAPADELAYARAHFFAPHRTRDPFGNSAVRQSDAYALLTSQTTDALANNTRAEHDYRVLQPYRSTDPNGNRTQVAFDILGLVAGTAVMGKSTDNQGDSLAQFAADLSAQQLRDFFADPLGHAAELLGAASTRIVYDLDQYATSQQPVFAATLARETHASDPVPPGGLKIQVGFAYSDGFGRVIQQKVQAEPGPLVEGGKTASPRWVGSGWIIFNNKCKPVRQYEPFFSNRSSAAGTALSDHRFEFGVAAGVSPTLCYDPVGRVVATLHPSHTWEKVVFDPWQQESWDVNDTVAQPDPSADPDVGDFFSRLPAGDYLPSWYTQRITLPDLAPGQPDPDRVAAQKAAAHAGTPARTHLDTLGRTFLTVAHNKVVCTGHDLDGTEDFFFTRVELDVEGNQRSVRDADQQGGDPLGRIVMRYDYDMLGTRIHQLSMEAGARWTLNDLAGKPIRAWDSRGHTFTTSYDGLRRPVRQTVRGTSSDSDPRTVDHDILVDTIQYGEPAPDATPAEQAQAQLLNLRTRVYRHCDSAGVVTNSRLDADGNPVEAYDFKGNLLHGTRQLASNYKAISDWQHAPTLDAETFETSTAYDALNRATRLVAPHSSRAGGQCNVIQPVFNEANLLERIDVWLEREAEPSALLDPSAEAPSPVGVANIDYDAKGQRLRVDYKNGARTSYGYDPLTFRLSQLITQRDQATFPGDDPQPPVTGWPGRLVQNRQYTYDPAGNITHIRDDAQQTIFFRNQRVEPSNDYVYDAVYRLIQASGREHLGQGGTPITHSHDDGGRVGLPQPGDGTAMGTYIERYVYGAVGNFVQMQHRGSDPQQAGWTRPYEYHEPSLIEDGSAGSLPKTSNRLTMTTLNPSGVNPVPEPYSYDGHGNMTSMPHLPLMRWNFCDQLQATSEQVVTNGGVPETTYHAYDATGQRVRKVTERQAAAGQTPTRKEERIYLGGFEVYREYESDGTTTTLERQTLHVMDDKQRVALVETRTLDTAGTDPAPRQLIRYQLGNHLGSVSLELDQQAQIISYEEYAPYGSSTYQAVRSQTETPKRYRYTGMERDEETGFSYHGARYYAPWLGRWLNCDPAGLVDGTNLFRYTIGNPVTLADPAGTDSRDGESNHPPDPDHPVVKAVVSVVKTTSKAIGLHRLGAAADRAEREIYHAQNLLRTSLAREAIKALDRSESAIARSADEAAVIADDASRARNIARTSSQQKLTLPGKALSKAVDKAPSLEVVHANYGNPHNPELPPETRIGIAEKIVEKSGSSRPWVNGVSVGFALLGAFFSGLQIGGGLREIHHGDVAAGVVDVSEGTTNLGLTIYTFHGVRTGSIEVAAGTGVASFTAGVVAAGSLLLGFEESRRALTGRKTLVEEAREFYEKQQQDAIEEGQIEGPSLGGWAKYEGAAFGHAMTGPIYWGRRGMTRALELSEPLWIPIAAPIAGVGRGG